MVKRANGLRLSRAQCERTALRYQNDKLARRHGIRRAERVGSNRLLAGLSLF